nr:unnamed protein product [Callosobruchus analis]
MEAANITCISKHSPTQKAQMNF